MVQGNIGGVFIFKFHPVLGGFAVPPDTKAELLEESNDKVKVRISANGEIKTWPLHTIRERVPYVGGGRRRHSRKATRKGSRKSRKGRKGRKGSRKSRKSRRTSRK